MVYGVDVQRILSYLSILYTGVYKSSNDQWLEEIAGVRKTGILYSYVVS